jgi:hypothetical protein
LDIPRLRAINIEVLSGCGLIIDSRDKPTLEAAEFRRPASSGDICGIILVVSIGVELI